jgi:hypothetical protein
VIAHGHPVPMTGRDLRGRAREASRYRQEAVRLYLQAQKRTTDASWRAASARDRYAEAIARSARAGIGDVTVRNRMAGLQETAATADRRLSGASS